MVSHTMYYEQCLKDVARGEIFACSGHPMCSSFSLYARECALHGFIVDWIDSTQCGETNLSSVKTLCIQLIVSFNCHLGQEQEQYLNILYKSLPHSPKSFEFQQSMNTALTAKKWLLLKQTCFSFDRFVFALHTGRNC